MRTLFFLFLSGLCLLTANAAPLQGCTVPDEAVAEASLSGLPDHTLCKAIFWNAYAGCINRGYSSIFCSPGIILIGNQVWKHISTIDNTQSVLVKLCSKGGNMEPSCALDLAYFTSEGSQASYTTIDHGVSYTVRSVSCPISDVVTTRPC